MRVILGFNGIHGVLRLCDVCWLVDMAAKQIFVVNPRVKLCHYRANSPDSQNIKYSTSDHAITPRYTLIALAYVDAEEQTIVYVTSSLGVCTALLLIDRSCSFTLPEICHVAERAR